MATLSLDTGMTNRLLPWHFAVDNNLRIVSLGQHLASRMKKDCIGMYASDMFRIARPVDISWDFESLCIRTDKPFLFITKPKQMLSTAEYLKLLEQSEDDRSGDLEDLESMYDQDSQNQHFRLLNSSSPTTSISSASTNISAAGSDVLEARSRLLKSSSHIKLHGEMIHDSKKNILVFIGNPLVMSLQELEDQGIHLADLPVHCHGREVLYGAMCQYISAQNSNDIHSKMSDLDNTLEQINLRKSQIDQLLHSILPPVCIYEKNLNENKEYSALQAITCEQL